MATTFPETYDQRAREKYRVDKAIAGRDQRTQQRSEAIAMLRKRALELRSAGAMDGELPNIHDDMGDHDISAASRQLRMARDANGNLFIPTPARVARQNGQGLDTLPQPATPTRTPPASLAYTGEDYNNIPGARDTAYRGPKLDWRDQAAVASNTAVKGSTINGAPPEKTAPPAPPSSSASRDVFGGIPEWRPGEYRQTPTGVQYKDPLSGRIVNTSMWVPPSPDQLRKDAAGRVAVDGSPNSLDRLTSTTYRGDIVPKSGPLAGQSIGYDPSKDRIGTRVATPDGGMDIVGRRTPGAVEGHITAGVIRDGKGNVYDPATGRTTKEAAAPAPSAPAATAAAYAAAPQNFRSTTGGSPYDFLPESHAPTGTLTPTPAAPYRAGMGDVKAADAYGIAPRPPVPQPSTSPVAGNASAPSVATPQPSPAMTAYDTGKAARKSVDDALNATGTAIEGAAKSVATGTGNAVRGAANLFTGFFGDDEVKPANPKPATPGAVVPMGGAAPYGATTTTRPMPMLTTFNPDEKPPALRPGETSSAGNMSFTIPTDDRRKRADQLLTSF